MDVFLSKIRKYLRDDPNVEIINVHGRGYKLLGQLRFNCFTNINNVAIIIQYAELFHAPWHFF